MPILKNIIFSDDDFFKKQIKLVISIIVKLIRSTYKIITHQLKLNQLYTREYIIYIPKMWFPNRFMCFHVGILCLASFIFRKSIKTVDVEILLIFQNLSRQFLISWPIYDGHWHLLTTNLFDPLISRKVAAYKVF